MIVIGNDDASGKAVDPKAILFVANFCGIEHAPDVVPVEGSDKPLFDSPIGQLLSPDFERERRILSSSDSDVALVEVESGRLTADLGFLLSPVEELFCSSPKTWSQSIGE